TWEYDGHAWSSIETTTQPTNVDDPAFAYDASRAAVVLAGGTLRSDSNGVLSDQTWAYDGVDWKQQASLRKALRGGSAVFDTDASVVRVVGGMVPGSRYTNAIEELGAAGWNQPAAQGDLVPREALGLVYDPVHHQTLLFGG